MTNALYVIQNFIGDEIEFCEIPARRTAPISILP